MKDQETLFIVAFICTAALVLYFYGSTITGYASKTMYCTADRCYDTCNTNSDCDSALCCQKFDFGICMVSCEEEYRISPPESFDIDISRPVMEQPRTVVGKTAVYPIILGLMIFLGIIYLILKRK